MNPSNNQNPNQENNSPYPNSSANNVPAPGQQEQVPPSQNQGQVNSAPPPVGQP